MQLFDKMRDKLRTVARAIGAHLPKTRRGWMLFYAAVSVVAVIFVGSLGVAVWSAYPSFCKSCHHVKPFYRSWATSVHGKENVGCTQCHFKPGIGPYVAGKLNGLVEVVKYFSGGYPVKLRSRVSDVSCLREGCHSTGKLVAEPVKFGKIRFVHDEHSQPSRGPRLRCASCHSASLHSEDKTVSRRVCFTCHFAPPRDGETREEREVRTSQGKCDTCHEVPKKVTTHVGVTLDHEKYAASEDECARCHGNVTRGEGTVLKDRCLTCHNEGLGHLDEFAKTESVHEIHVTDHQVACFECHDEISHGLTGMAAFRGEPFHARRSGPLFRPHRAAEKLYAGSGGAGVEDLPGPMFAADVQCAGCHQERPGPPGVPVPELGGREPSAHKACVVCHEEGYDKLAARWQSAFDGYV